MKNISAKSKKQKVTVILRYEDGNYLCPAGHELIKSGNDFVCKKCVDVFKKNS